jgi:diguanylate cyclase (GGDEF)-like protein
MDWFGGLSQGMSHLQWLWLMVGLQLVLFGLGWLGAAGVSSDEQVHMRGLAVFNIGVGISLALIGLRGNLPYLLTHTLSNLCSMLSFAMLWRTALAMTDQAQHAREQTVLMAVGAALVLWFGQSPQTGQQRVTAYFLVVAWIAFRGSWQVGRRLWQDRLRGTGATMLVVGWLLGGLFLHLGLSGLLSTVSTEFTSDTKPTLVLAYVLLAAGFVANMVFANIVFGRMVRQLRRLSRHDMLTGLYNRRAIVDALQLEWDRFRRGGAAFTVACVDIDLFKQINDLHGHAAGDAALVGTAQALRAQIRPGDVIGRSGGEEFLVLLMCADQDTALGIAERMRSAVAAATAIHPDPARRLTVSIGLATALATDATIDALVARADAALYQAKGGGRDRVCMAPTQARGPGLSAASAA